MSSSAWQVTLDTSVFERTDNENRLNIAYGIMLINGEIISTNDITLEGALHIKQKDSLEFPTDYKDVFLDLQKNKYLYANVATGTGVVTLEYSSQPPSGNGAIEITGSGFQRVPLAFITNDSYIVDLRPLGGSSIGSAVEPFTIFVEVSTEEGVDNIITLWPGTINQLLPTNMLSEFFETPQSTRYVKLRVVTNGKAVTGATIVIEASSTGAIDTIQGSAPTTFDILIGIVINGTPYQVTDGNIVATLTEALREGKAVPSPGLSPYNFYYTWEINQ